MHPLKNVDAVTLHCAADSVAPRVVVGGTAQDDTLFEAHVSPDDGEEIGV